MIALVQRVARRAGFITLTLALTSSAQIASACPTCKNALSENYIAAYGWSILFMMSMPFVIFGALAGYFYWEVRKAKKQQQQEPSRKHWPSDVLDPSQAASEA